MVSCGSSFLWCSCKQYTGQNLFSLSEPDGWGGRKPWAACTAVGRAMVSGSLLHIIDSPSKCAHLETWGPEAKNWGSHSLLMTQKPEGSIASLCEKRKKSLVWNGERGGGGRSCLHNDKGTVWKSTEPWVEVNLCTTRSGGVRAASPCHKPRLSKRRSRSALSSTVGIFISRVWRPSESPTTHLKYLEHTIPEA